MRGTGRLTSMVLATLAVLGLAACGSGSSVARDGRASSSQVSAVTRGRLDSAYGHLPLAFVPNRGQSDSRVLYEASGSGFAAGLTDDGVLLSLGRGHTAGRGLSVSFVGEGHGVRPVARARLAGRVSYLVGRNRSDWHTNLPTFLGASYRAVWPGIDATFSGSQGRLEYTFAVAPGADPGRIALGYAGQRGLHLALDGSLAVSTAGGRSVRQLAPHAYQVRGGLRVPVASFYVLHGDRVGIRVGGYDHRLPLIIDPTVELAYSTYLGGNQGDQGNGIAVDSAGNAYITGNTQSTDFGTPGAYQSTSGGGQDAFVAKLSADGRTLDYVTYIGGSDSDFGLGIAVDSSGEPYITGATFSSNFPVMNPLPGQSKLTETGEGGFAAKLNSSGTALVFSTLLAGNNFTQGSGIAVDSQGAAYITGETDATDFPTTPGAPRTTQTGAAEDAFVTKLSGSGALDYGTLVGGSGADEGTAIAVDSAGGAWLTGESNSSDLATTDGYQKTANNGSVDAFVVHLAPDGKSLVYASDLGGSSFDDGNGIALDAQGNVYVAGVTDSTDFPTTTGAAQTTFGGGDSDAFVAKFSAAGGLVYSTFLGGSVDDAALGIAVDSTGSAYVTGDTEPIPMEDVATRGSLVARGAHADPAAGGFPVVNPIQSTSGGGEDEFVSELNPDGSALSYSTFLGGSDDDGGTGIAVDPAGSAYVTGFTNSTDFPTVNAEQSTYNNGDAFVAKIATVNFALLVTTSGTGTGTVASAPAGINCGSTCAASFAAGSQVTLTATASAGSTFDHWSGACSGTAACTITMSAAQNAAATFNKVATPPALGVPVNTGPPVITGQPLPGKTLSCSTGTWSNSPTSFSYRWKLAGTSITGATGSSYTVQIADEASGPNDTLTCVVTASNAAGVSSPASSAGVLVASGSTKCPAPTGTLGGSKVGVLALGETKAQARKRLKRFQVTQNRFDNFCLFAGWGIRAAYPSPKLVDSVKPSERRELAGRIVIALTANPFYAFKGVRPGMRKSAVANRLYLGKPFRIGINYWYIASARPANGVLKVRGGVIQEVGLVNRLLTADRNAQKRLLSSFPNG
jgi:hypothetical protein